MPITRWVPRATGVGIAVDGRRNREIDGHVGRGPRRPVGIVDRPETGDLERRLRCRATRPAGPCAVADHEHSHRAHRRRLVRVPTADTANHSLCRRVIAGARCLGKTNVTFPREAACDTMRSGTPSSARDHADRKRRVGGSLADGAEERHCSARRSPRRTRAAPPTMSGNRRFSSIVTETLTSESSPRPPQFGALEHLEHHGEGSRAPSACAST